jgi:hypothetical protein
MDPTIETKSADVAELSSKLEELSLSQPKTEEI